MEEIKQLENEIKYFELLNAGLSALKFLHDGEEINVKQILRQTQFLKNLKIDFDKSTLFMPFISAIASRQFITVFREGTDNIDFSKIEHDKRYLELKNDLFSKCPDLPEAECNKILKSIANELAHGNVIKLFDFNKLAEYYGRLKYEKTPNAVSVKILKNDLLKLFIELLSPEFNFTSRYEKLSNQVVQKRQTPKTISLHFDISKMEKLVMIADIARLHEKFYIDYDERIDFDVFYTDEKLKNFIEEIKIKYGEEKIDLDEIQKEDLFNIIQHYYINSTFNLFNIKQIFNVCIPRVLHDAQLQKKELNRISNFLIKMLGATNPKELQKIILRSCVEEEFDDLETNCTLYAYEINNLYSELLITLLINLLKQLENKNLFAELAETEFIEKLTADLTGKTEQDISEKDKLKIIRIIRNAFTHNRYINNANKTIDIYDEKSKKIVRTLNGEKQNEGSAKSELEFKFGLDIADLEDIKDLCLQVLVDNYKNTLNQTKNT